MSADLAGDGQSVPLHPESVDGSDRELRWVIPAGTLPFVGEPARIPAVLQALLDDGTIESVTVEPVAIRTRLGADRSWRVEGARARNALLSAVTVPQHWAANPTAGGADSVLRMAVHEVIDGEVGLYIRSHGGAIELVDVHDGVVEVRLDGACAHCPSSEVTLTSRFERAVRARCPAVVSISAQTSKPAHPGRTWLGLTLGRRR